VLYREASSAVAIYCFGPQKTQFVSVLIERTVVDITQLGCTQLADISLPASICTFARHKKSKHVCALRTAYSLAQWLNIYILSLQYAKCTAQPAFHSCFPDGSVGITSTYILSQRAKKYVSIYLNNDDLKPEVKIETPSGHAVLNKIQWFILVTFKSNIPKNEVHEVGDSQHTPSVYCGRYTRITSENTQVYLSKKD